MTRGYLQLIRASLSSEELRQQLNKQKRTEAKKEFFRVMNENTDLRSDTAELELTCAVRFVSLHTGKEWGRINPYLQGRREEKKNKTFPNSVYLLHCSIVQIEPRAKSAE